MKTYAITRVRQAVEETIAELEKASLKATLNDDRMADRNLGVNYRVADMKRLLREVIAHEEYITQPRFEKYFE